MKPKAQTTLKALKTKTTQKQTNETVNMPNATSLNISSNYVS